MFLDLAKVYIFSNKLNISLIKMFYMQFAKYLMVSNIVTKYGCKFIVIEKKIKYMKSSVKFNLFLKQINYYVVKFFFIDDK